MLYLCMATVLPFFLHVFQLAPDALAKKREERRAEFPKAGLALLLAPFSEHVLWCAVAISTVAATQKRLNNTHTHTHMQHAHEHAHARTSADACVRARAREVPVAAARRA